MWLNYAWASHDTFGVIPTTSSKLGRQFEKFMCKWMQEYFISDINTEMENME